MAEPLKQVPALHPLQRFWRLLSAERKDITSVYIFALIAGLISLSLPLGIQAIFNYVAGGQVTTSWVILIIVVILGVLANGTVQIVQTAISERMQQRIFAHSALEFAYRIPRLKFDVIRHQEAPELVNRFFDTLTIQKGLSKILMDISASSLQIIFGLLLLAFYHPFFIVFGIFLLVLLFIVLRFTGPQGLKTSLEESKYKYKVAYWLEEMARTLDSFKLAGATRLPMAKTDAMVVKYLDARKKHFRVLLSNYMLILGFKVLIICSMLVIGSLLVFGNELNVGQFVAMEIVLILLLSAVDKLIMSAETMYDVLTALEKIGSLTDLPLESDLGNAIPDMQSGLGVSLKNVTLKFPDMRIALIRDVSLELKPGEKLNILTSDDGFVVHFFRLLMGFYEGYSGSISFNGLPLQNVQLENLRDQTGGYSTLQEIFDGSLLDNITVGVEGVDLQRVLAIIKAVGLENFVREEKEGLEIQLHTGGGSLPESIRRKIILARSLATHPKLLLLNEPFEGLDDTDRDRFLDYIDRHMPSATVILASAKLASPKFAHQICHVIDQQLLPVQL